MHGTSDVFSFYLQACDKHLLYRFKAWAGFWGFLFCLNDFVLHWSHGINKLCLVLNNWAPAPWFCINLMDSQIVLIDSMLFKTRGVSMCALHQLHLSQEGRLLVFTVLIKMSQLKRFDSVLKLLFIFRKYEWGQRFAVYSYHNSS